jgi:hypothetical protein
MMEQQVKASESNCLKLFENSSLSLVVFKYVTGDDGEVIDLVFDDFNPSTEAMIKRGRHELIGKSFTQIFGSELTMCYLPSIREMRMNNQDGHPMS